MIFSYTYRIVVLLLPAAGLLYLYLRNHRACPRGGEDSLQNTLFCVIVLRRAYTGAGGREGRMDGWAFFGEKSIVRLCLLPTKSVDMIHLWVLSARASQRRRHDHERGARASLGFLGGMG